jgi:hypothetical protein
MPERNDLLRSTEGPSRMTTHASGHSSTTDADLRASLLAALEAYPALRLWVPLGSLTSAKITSAAMAKYDGARLARYFHHLNLPLLLHGALFATDVKLRALLRSILTTLEDFCVRFQNTEGARGFLRPLWQDMWSDTPQLWSVVSGAYMSLAYEAHGIRVLGFESRIADNSNDDARDDITITLAGATIHIEIEAWHSASFSSLTDDALTETLLARADKKAAKFRRLPSSRRGIVAVVCVISDGDEGRTLPLRISHIPGRAPNVGWGAFRLVGMHHGDDYRFGVKPFAFAPPAL